MYLLKLLMGFGKGETKGKRAKEKCTGLSEKMASKVQ